MFLRSSAIKKFFLGAYRNFRSISNAGIRFSLLIPLAFCSGEKLKKIKVSNPEKLTHNFLLRQASSQTANSASQLLNQTVNAINDTAEEYKKALNDVMSLIDESQKNLGNEFVQQEVADLIVECRSKVNGYKTQFVELESLLDYVEKVVVSTSETTFLVGAEYSSVSLSENLHAAKQEILKIKKAVELLEQEYLKMQQSFIKSSTKFEEEREKR